MKIMILVYRITMPKKNEPTWLTWVVYGLARKWNFSKLHQLWLKFKYRKQLRELR